MKFLKCALVVEIALVLCAALSVRARDCDQEIKAQILHKYRLDSMTYEIDVLASQLKTTSLDSTDGLAIRPISEKEPLGLFSVLATIMRGGQAVETGQVSLRIRKFAEVLVTTDMLRIHDLPAPEKLELQRMDITSLLEQPVQSCSAIAGYRLKRNIGKGQVLTMSAVEPVPDIDVGGEVSIICSNSLFTVTTSGLALQKGSVGEQIRVKNNASNKIVLARVVDQRTVTVQP